LESNLFSPDIQVTLAEHNRLLRELLTAAHLAYMARVRRERSALWRLYLQSGPTIRTLPASTAVEGAGD